MPVEVTGRLYEIPHAFPDDVSLWLGSNEKPRKVKIKAWVVYRLEIQTRKKHWCTAGWKEVNGIREQHSYISMATNMFSCVSILISI